MAEEGLNKEVALRDTMLFPREYHEDAMGLEPLDRLALYDALMDFAFYDRETSFGDPKMDTIYRYATARMRPALERFDEKCRRNRRQAGRPDEEEVMHRANVENLREMRRMGGM